MYNSEKTVFNDPLPHQADFTFNCPSCRANGAVLVNYYPHTNHRDLHCCPFCGDDDFNWELVPHADRA